MMTKKEFCRRTKVENFGKQPGDPSNVSNTTDDVVPKVVELNESTNRNQTGDSCSLRFL